MRSLSLLFIGILLSSFTGKINSSTSLQEYHLKGKVKSITDSAFVSVLADKVYAVRTCTFDKMGNLLSENMSVMGADSFATSPLTFKNKYEYNAQDHMTEEEEDNMDGTLSWRTFFTYGDHAHLTETRRYDKNDLLMQRDVFEYDEENNVLATKRYNGSGACTGSSSYTYDGHSNLVKEVSDDNLPGGENKNMVTYQYDNNGRLTECYGTQRADEEHTLRSRTVYTDFDNAGNGIRWAEINISGNSSDTINYKRSISYY